MILKRLIFWPEDLSKDTLPAGEWDEFIAYQKEAFEVVDLAEEGISVPEWREGETPAQERVRDWDFAIDRTGTLLLSGNRDHLLAGRILGFAVLPCTLVSGQNDFPGFSLVLEDFFNVSHDFLDKAYRREKGLPWEIVTTERMIVREEMEGDLDAIYDMYKDDQHTRYLPPPYPEREDELDYIRKYRTYIYEPYGYGLWILVEKATGAGIGRAGFTPKVYEDDETGPELGYLIHPDYANQGYCKEALKAILPYGFNELGFEVVYCQIRPENEISIHIAEEMGFTFDKILTGQKHKMYRYKCLKSGFPSLQ